jgi:hypothetical protein
MISAFGVDHGGISKSFVNGKWVKAAEATPKQLSHIARGGQYKAAHGLQPRDQAWKDKRAEQHKIMSGALSHGVKNNPDVTPGSAGTYRVGGQSYIISNLPKEAVPKKLRRSVMGHEAVHAGPKRSSYRLHNQILGNPKKMMREEARADYISGGHFSQHPDAGSMYAQAARASHGIKTSGPKSNFKFQSKTKKAFKRGGIDAPKISNRDALSNVKTNIQAIFPHYELGGKRGDKAIGSYRKLQNKMQAKGVKGGRSL